MNDRLRQSLQAAELRADRVTAARAAAFAAAGHELRQPLQTLVLLQGLLARLVEGAKAQKLVARLDETLNTMSGLLARTALDPHATPFGADPSPETGGPGDAAPAMPGVMPHSIESPTACPNDAPVILVVDDDREVRDALRDVLEDDGRVVEVFPNCEAFLSAYRPGREACLLVDAYLPGMSGLELLERLHQQGDRMPAVMITGNSDVAMAVKAMKFGACDFIEKPVSRSELLTIVARALDQSRDSNQHVAWQEEAVRHLASLTPRQRQIMNLVLAGHPSKNIASDLGISQRTVENHRAAIMKRTGTKSLPALARLAVIADKSGNAEPHSTL
jgi:FixJ family two-component response regulator